MNHPDLSLTNYHALKSSKFSSIEKITIYPDLNAVDAISQLSIDIELSSNDTNAIFLSLSFKGVQQIKINSDNSYMHESVLDIISIRERQWENLNYFVKEKETGWISFYCSTFEAKIIKL